MGQRYGPSYANIYMSEWEREALAKCPLHPLFYLRFLDDIIGAQAHGEDAFQQFVHILNTHHPSIKLRQEHSDFEINEPPDALLHFMVHMINNQHSGVAWAVQGRFSLEIKNVVYAIQCRSCGLIYVGETGARLRAVTAAPVCCTSSGAALSSGYPLYLSRTCMT